MPFIHDHHLMLQHDNLRPHVARICTQFLEAENIPVLAWSAYSPDMSPIKHVWDALDRRIRQLIKHRVDFKIVLITYKALNGLAPQYLSELLSHYSPPRLLRSQNSGHLIIPRISKSPASGRSFFYLAPKLWNNLPNTVREADTLCQFKSRLKTLLFNLAYI